MNITQHPELLQRLAASYALGTLRGGARRRFEALAREHAAVRAAALVWQTHWSGLAELQPGAAPDPAVWLRTRIWCRPTRQTPPCGRLHSPRLWRLATGGAACCFGVVQRGPAPWPRWSQW
jgi:anti-sigma-K factor RskA